MKVEVVVKVSHENEFAAVLLRAEHEGLVVCIAVSI
jgi:hypothetical protein